MEITVPFDKEIFENSNRKFWLNGSRPQCDLTTDSLACAVERDRTSRKLPRRDLTKRENDCKFGFAKLNNERRCKIL